MSQPKISPIIRLLPSLTDLVFLAPLVLVLGIGAGAKSLLEGDTGWHIRTGEWILQNGRVPDKDIFSYTKAGEPWFAWEWLWDVGAALLHQHGGMAAVILVNLLLIGLTMVLVYRMTRAKCNNDLIAFAVTGLAMGATSMHWLARPHLLGWLFLVVFYWILERAQDGRKGLLWTLPVATVLWTNIHGSFFLGIVLILTYAAGEFAAGVFTSDAGGAKGGALRAKPYVLAAVACGVATFINPYFYHLHVHVINFLRDSYYFDHILEYRATTLRGAQGRYIEPLMLLAVVAAVWNVRRRFVYTLLLLSWVHLGMSVVRNVPIFALLSAPLIAEMLGFGLVALKDLPVVRWLATIGREVQDISAELGVMDRMWRFHLVSVATVALIAIALSSVAPAPRLQASYDPKVYPEAALATLRNSPANARIFTDDEWGDFLIYRLYPERKVFVDGRADLYGPKFGQAYMDVMNVTYDWEAKLALYQVDTILLSARSPLASALKESRHWRVVHDDSLAIVFRKAEDVSLAFLPQVSVAGIRPGTDRGLATVGDNNGGLQTHRTN